MSTPTQAKTPAVNPPAWSRARANALSRQISAALLILVLLVVAVLVLTARG